MGCRHDSKVAVPESYLRVIRIFKQNEFAMDSECGYEA